MSNIKKGGINKAEISINKSKQNVFGIAQNNSKSISCIERCTHAHALQEYRIYQTGLNAASCI